MAAIFSSFSVECMKPSPQRRRYGGESGIRKPSTTYIQQHAGPAMTRETTKSYGKYTNGAQTERRFKPHKISPQTTSRVFRTPIASPGLVPIVRENWQSSGKSCETSHCLGWVLWARFR